MTDYGSANKLRRGWRYLILDDVQFAGPPERALLSLLRVLAVVIATTRRPVGSSVLCHVEETRGTKVYGRYRLRTTSEVNGDASADGVRDK